MNLNLQLFLSFAKLGVLMFGGGYAMLPILEHEVVDRQKWLTPEEVLDLYALAQCTPGVIAVNTATKTGYKMKGVSGALAATVGVIAPSFFIILILSGVLKTFSSVPQVQSMLAGIRIASCAMMVNTLLKLGKAGIKDWIGGTVFILALVASFWFGLSPVWLVLLAIFAGIGADLLKGGKTRD